MKCTKRFAALLLALVMTLALSIPALADEGAGSITIDNAVVGQTYNAYQLLYLESYNSTSGAYAYKANSAWAAFIASEAIKDVYLKTDDQGYVTWVTGADAAAFAKLAQVEAAKMTAADATATATTTEVKFENLKLGYYLVDSTLGTLCSLDTTNPSVTIQEKNTAPTVDKTVQEDSKIGESDEWGEENDADIGQTVNFKTIVHTKKGAIGYVLHDVMSAGLTLDQNSIVVKVGETTLTKDTDYTVSFENEDNCTFEITFKQTYLDTITADTDIVVTYSAVLNENAVIYDGANTNKTKLNYGDESKFDTEWDETKTYTYKFDLVKTKSDDKVLNGATFKLYDAETGGNEIALVKESDGSYRVATATEKAAESFTAATIEAGKVTIKGLDGGTTYYLEEVTAPAGYNKLASRVPVEIESSNLDATIETDTWTVGGVKVVNQSGTELPSTGGMGTTVLYVLGAALVLCAGVLLVTRRRMSR